MTRFVSWNMGCATNRYRAVREQAWRYLLDLGPDVALVQEAALDVPSFVRAEGSLILRASYGDQRWGSGVFVRGGPRIERSIEAKGSYVVAAEIELDRPTLVASVHVCPGREHTKNMASLAMTLLPILRDRPFVVGGDLNASRHFDRVYRTRRHRAFVDALAACGAVDCHFQLHNREVQSYWGRHVEPYQLDHFFADATTARSVRACDVMTNDSTRRLSDHSVLLLDVATANGQSASRRAAPPPPMRG